jgi:hypothetical protein
MTDQYQKIWPTYVIQKMVKITPQNNREVSMSIKLLGNGIDAVTGNYLSQDITVTDVVDAFLSHKTDSAMPDIKLRLADSEPHYGIRYGLNANNLSEAGWGVVFAYDSDPAIREALSPLLELRREQANQKKPLYKEFTGNKGYTPGLEKDQFLINNNAAPGPVNPEKIPYYLLLVGDPETIPYEFQYLLDVAYAVGRINFNTIDEYAAYAHIVVAAERGMLRRTRQIAFFGVRNQDDPATALSTDHLVIPLSSKLEEKYLSSWDFNKIVGDCAVKSRLGSLLNEPDGPALLFTASHGIGFSSSRSLQREHQGALLCGDWPGPVEHRGPLSPDYYFSRDDVASAAGIAGLVSFHFACYGAGTPKYDDFCCMPDTPARMIAPRAMVAPLAESLLGHGGALAFIGHIERAWTYSFLWPGCTDTQIIFEDVISSLLDGCTVGFAMEAFNQKYCELATTLFSESLKIHAGRKRNDLQFAEMVATYNDARNYAIVGDPAVRLAVC